MHRIEDLRIPVYIVLHFCCPKISLPARDERDVLYMLASSLLISFLST